MLMNLYSVSDGDNVINKTLSSPLEIEIKLKNNFDPVRPTLFLSGDLDLILTKNYFHLVDLNRYYFVNNVERVNGNLVKLECVVDVLETYKNDVLTSNAQFNRNIKTGDYQNITIDTESKTIETFYSSGIDITDQNSMILTSVVGG